MILKNIIKIETKGLRKIKYYESLGYNTKSEFIELKVSDLTSGSRQKIEVKCDFCDKIVFITYKEYLRNISIGNKYSCSKKCGSLKAKESNNLKYGVDYPMILEDIQKKTKKTNLEKYGVEYLQQSDYIKNKTKNTILIKYGVDHISKSEEIRLKTSKISLDKNYIKYLSENISLLKCDLNNDHLFEINNDNYYHRNRSNLPLCTICNPIGDCQSIKEKNLHEFIKSIYDGEVIKSYRDGLEIDVYIPELKIGFEFNGLYWHSEEWKDRWYHLKKTNYFKDRNIRIIHIWEDDWTFREEIIKSQINNWLGLTKNRVFARKCEIREISTKISTHFLNENHIQGKDRSMVKIGLYHNNELVSLMTFNKSEGREKMEEGGWNLSRFCNRLDNNIIGGASKLLNYFIKKYNPKRIISYSDKDWSLGDLYFKLGFEVSHETKPDYKYIIKDKRSHKSKYRKSRLNTNLTESQFMIQSKLFKIWDCGKIKYSKII